MSLTPPLELLRLGAENEARSFVAGALLPVPGRIPIPACLACESTELAEEDYQANLVRCLGCGTIMAEEVTIAGGRLRALRVWAWRHRQ